jgi:hypothetical protein
MGEFRAVDQHQNIGSGSNRRSGDSADSAENLGQARNKAGEPDQIDFAWPKQRIKAGRLHAGTAGPDKADFALPQLLQRRHKTSTKLIARLLGHNDKDCERPLGFTR